MTKSQVGLEAIAVIEVPRIAEDGIDFDLVVGRDHLGNILSFFTV